MRFRIGAVPDNFEPDGSWRTLTEPGPLLMQVLATPVALVLGVTFLFLWQTLVPLAPLSMAEGFKTLFAILIILSFPVLICAHEVLHTLPHPGWGLHQETIIGAWPKTMLFYAHYDGALQRNTYLLVFAMPLLVISVLPLILGLLGLLPPTLASIAAWFSIWNALFACGDVLGFFLILIQVPAGAIIQNKGWRSYWKFPDSPIANEPGGP